MSGLFARSLCPLALMKSDSRIPIRFSSFSLLPGGGLFLVFGDDRIVHHVSMRLPNSNSNTKLLTLWSGLRVKIRTKIFAGFHHCPDNPSKLIRHRHSDETSGLFRPKRHDPFGQCAFVFASTMQQ